MISEDAKAILRTALAQHRDEQEMTGATLPLLSLARTRQLAKEAGCTILEVELLALQMRVLPERYHRNFGTVGWDGQARLLQATVAVVGVGGLGGWVVETLARMGIGHLILIDGDRFEENNLNRQLGCTEDTVGKPKVTCLAERVASVNGAVEVTPKETWLEEANAADLIADADVVVDALDTVPARLQLQKVASACQIPLVHGAIAGYTGQITTVFPGDPGLEAIYGRQPTVERGVETELGNPSATPMMISAWQSQEVVKILLNQGELLRQRMLLFDALAGDVTEIGLG
ncbi:MAG: HesA/MoeB/ThiF family protein [Chloroflexota bacterium]|nr:HesA/MoeB/ThiF family protein [Chloroflexota bacterium]